MSIENLALECDEKETKRLPYVYLYPDMTELFNYMIHYMKCLMHLRQFELYFYSLLHVHIKVRSLLPSSHSSRVALLFSNRTEQTVSVHTYRIHKTANEQEAEDVEINAWTIIFLVPLTLFCLWSRKWNSGPSKPQFNCGS